jgi:hypothetical protein
VPHQALEELVTPSDTQLVSLVYIRPFILRMYGENKAAEQCEDIENTPKNHKIFAIGRFDDIRFDRKDTKKIAHTQVFERNF